jgi:dTDP-4-dehydrorhamnose 3,5-epimerase
MEFRELSVGGAWEITPRVLEDPRGSFHEAFKGAAFAGHVGHSLVVRQVNTSTSIAGVVRGVHFAAVPPGQAKYVTCTHGAVLDYVVDIRLGSPTFGTYDTVLLDDTARRAVYIPEGLGHLFVSLQDDSTVTYLCSQPYAPGREFGITPFCETLALDLPTLGRDGRTLEYRLSDKDRAAPDLSEAERLGVLPTYAAQQEFVTSLREEG